MKSLLWFGLLTTLSLPALAENHYSALPCPVDEAYLQVENTSPEVQSFWFQPVGISPFYESYMEVKALGHLSLPLSESRNFSDSALALKALNPALRFSAHCKGQASAWKLSNETSPWKKLDINSSKDSLEIYIANLAQQKNSLEIEFEGTWGLLGSQSLALGDDFKTLRQTLTLPQGTKTVRLRAEGRWVGKAFLGSREMTLRDETVRLKNVSTPAPTTRYFLFTSRYPDTHESFVVPMQNPKLIQESLAQIANPDTARLLVARIEKSLSNLNRDFSSPLKTPWSWQVMEAQNYADLAHISCNGTPQIVEERLNSWMSETGGTICFWNYRVTRELSPQEIKQSPSWSRPALGSLQHKH